MKKLSFGLFSLTISICLFIPTGLASAAGFNQNRIIDDGVFDNTNSMNASQIDSFLNSFPNSCLSTNSGFKAIDPVGYNPTSGYQYGGFVTAGQVIYDASQAYGINPQVLLTTLQKEQSLVVGGAGYCNNGDQHKYAAAVGYGCPDSGTTYSYTGLNLYQRNGVTVTSTGTTCVNSASKAGFTQQVIRAAWLLKFGEQRSKGNINWAVIKGNWDNSDDPQTCYGGPMTQGTFQRCPSGATTYYDGYTTIDGVAVHMDSGATAALYWYTPHFSGNQHFYDIFTGWFGSTQFPQPIGGSLYQQASNGALYLVTDGAKYYIPSWDMMMNYQLDNYPAIPADDATISGFTNGGVLSNLVYDSNGVYLVNNRVRHPVSADMCTKWGFACSDGTKVNPLGSVFQTQYLSQGPLITELSQYGGVTYKMDTGKKDPIANTKTLSDLGYASIYQLPATAVNSTQPLGPLLNTLPGVVKFYPNPSLYYYDGTSYFAITDMSIYYDWGLNYEPILSIPTSAYTSTPPSSTILPLLINDNAEKYLIDSNRKIKVTSFPNLWKGTFGAGPTNLTGRLKALDLASFAKIGYDYYQLDTSKRHYIATIADYNALQTSPSNITYLSSNKSSLMNEGQPALPNGKVLSLNDGTGRIFVTNAHKLLQIPDPQTFVAYGYSWGAVISYDSSLTSEYPVDGLLPLASKTTGGDYRIIGGQNAFSLTQDAAKDYGLIDTSIPTLSNGVVKSTPSPLPRFMRNYENGNIYYASGGAIHYVGSYQSFAAYGGTRSKVAPINTSIQHLFIEAQPI